MATPRLAAVIVTHDSAEALAPTLARLAPQLADEDELVVVDCASARPPTSVVEAFPAARLIRLDVNAGFAGGARVGAAATRAPLLFFLNPDAVPAPGCLDALRAAAGAHPAWAAWQALVTLPGDERVNTRGGVVHWLGLAWAGGCGEPVSGVPPRPVEVGFASGAALCVRREAWEACDGFDASYFMYMEDVDLSLRLRLAGWGVGMVPAARVTHDYAFEKGARKWFLLERNRLRTVLSVYPAAVLVAIAPALVLLEAALLAVAARGGWLGAKLRAQAAVARDLPAIARRRRRAQATRRVGAATFAGALSAALDSPFLGAAASVPALARAQAVYWGLVRWALTARPAG